VPGRGRALLAAPSVFELGTWVAGGAWYGEVSLRAEDLSEVGFDPGVLGCGVVVCNVSEDVVAACGRLGEGLARAYAGARLPNGHDGALQFEEGTL
jgi:hypothetical protein